MIIDANKYDTVLDFIIKLNQRHAIKTNGTYVYSMSLLLSDSRVMMSYLPSTLAAATMIHVIKEIEPFNATEYIEQLLGLLKISEVCAFNLTVFSSTLSIIVEFSKSDAGLMDISEMTKFGVLVMI